MIKKGILSFLAVLFSVFAFSQKKLTEGIIQYNVVINTGSEKPKAADFLDGANTTVYLKGNNSRSDMVSALGTQSTLVDGARNSIVILKDYGSQKYMINLTPANWKELNNKYLDVQYSLQDSTRNILGYNCKKAVGKLADGTPVEVWYTPDVQVDNKNFSVMGQNLPGLALEFKTNMGSTSITYTVSKISFTTVPVARFDLPKAGYRIMTYEESKGM
ncbi:GLPGLI family protein [Cnuella takakiae]|uniref:GLPGLI family protein n=1 Tax=Cnuella takakiae TaxID=1302690 RepID=A0A1M5AGV8_9BACT|nr:hypothetical protein [Cnuella takakiae]OLY91968.1 hypothetical protein BUE76_08720 [Cnuella takakiae]SHF29433.1 GLPGLI family protein [Cnuella takakiae]